MRPRTTTTAERDAARRRLTKEGHSTVSPGPRCDVAAQCVMAGPQDHTVRGGNAQVTGRGHGVISMRVGRMLVYLEDRDALQAWRLAIEKALAMQEDAFGPEPAPHHYVRRTA
jgi:hypothetical protein